MCRVARLRLTVAGEGDSLPLRCALGKTLCFGGSPCSCFPVRRGLLKAGKVVELANVETLFGFWLGWRGIRASSLPENAARAFGDARFCSAVLTNGVSMARLPRVWRQRTAHAPYAATAPRRSVPNLAPMCAAHRPALAAAAKPSRARPLGATSCVLNSASRRSPCGGRSRTRALSSRGTRRS